MGQNRLIKKEDEYQSAMQRLLALMDHDLPPGSDEEAEFELLTLLIEDYERKIVPPVQVDPIEAILFRMDQQNLTRKDLQPYIGSLSKVSEVLSRKRPLSLAMIRKLHEGLGIPAEVLIKAAPAEDVDLSAEPQYDYTKFPLQEMYERGCFPNFSGGVKQLKDYAEELIRSFMQGVRADGLQPALLRAPLHQKGTRTMDEYALLAWRICVLKKARAQKLKASYQPGLITETWLRELAQLSRFETGPRVAREYLAEHGIALVIEPHFKKTYLDGAAVLDGDTPIVGLTLRHDRLDNFWFALMHELIHVQMHLTPDQGFIADNLEEKAKSAQELDADEGAREALIPAQAWDASRVKLTHELEDAKELAHELRIQPAIVAGRLRYETQQWRLLSSLIGEKGEVSKHFDPVYSGPA